MMFTKDQAQKLIDNTTLEWTSINGVNGYKFTNKTDSSKYIFLSAAGAYNPTFFEAASNGYYWSTTYRSSSNAWYLDFDSSGVSTHDNYRCCGRSIRGVQ